MAESTAAAAAGVLDASPPRFTPAEVAAIAARLFGVAGEARDLGSERDQTFLVDDGAGGGVLKISNLGEDPAVLDLEAGAILHIGRADPGLPVARPVLPLGADPAAGAPAYRTTTDGPDGRHLVRMFERMRGRSGVAAADLDDAALRDYGATVARLGLALRGFFHPAAGRVLLWDAKQALGLRPLVGDIADPARRALVSAVLDRYEQRVAPALPRLRAQVVHGDLSLDNVLLDDAGRIAGIVDFGDIAHTALVGDVAAALASLVRARHGQGVFRVARVVLDGHAGVAPLEPAEVDLLADLVATRLATIVTISAWRVRRYPENAEYIQAWDGDSWTLLEQLDEIGLDRAATLLGARAKPSPSRPLAERRRRALGPALTPLTYTRPVHLVRGQGVWLEDADGRRLLDAYNNVPVVGHCHPRVTEAVVRQTRALNTHARYLYEPLVELGERLAASMPAGSGLDTVTVVNSGSEANDLAWRMATAVTGRRGGVVTEYAYHGVTEAIADLSPEEWHAGHRPGHVETFAPPHGAAPAAADVDAAFARLRDRGVEPAAVYVDGGFTSDGILVPPPAYLADVAARTQAAGALFVADEVQAGHGRAGDGLWSFAASGARPDFVTLGKPMGNGYPVAAVVTRREVAEAFARVTDVFSTFGGNPVAAAAAIAVLDVIADEGLVERAAAVGEALRAALADVAAGSDRLGQVRGRGLLVGVDVVAAGGEPDPARARRLMDGVRERGVLVGTTGPHGHVLKIRPPLAFGHEHVDVLVSALAGALAEG